jgi:PPOX class probable F420-dependent enzyme
MGKPHAVPVCFALARASIFIALDEKPKDVPVTRLKRVRNILENPHVALISDRYTEEWNLLAFVMVRGRAELLDPDTEEHAAAVRLLRGKYHQYETMRIDENPVIAIRSEKAASWGALAEPDTSGPQVLDTIHGRRSVRRYLQKRVPEDLVERVLEAARWAPSPHGRQPWRFAVFTKEATKEHLARAMGEEWRANLEMDGQSLGAAAQNALLTAYDSGLDAGWMCAPLFCPEKVVEALGLDTRLVPHALLTLGYAEGDPPKRRSRRPLDELVVYRD